jgi:hypothetical protein
LLFRFTKDVEDICIPSFPFLIFCFCISIKFIKKNVLIERQIFSYLSEITSSLTVISFKELKERLEALLGYLSKLIEGAWHFFLKYRLGCVSSGGIPASTEAHGLSLLSAQLSTFDVFASFFFPLTNIQTGGGNNGLVHV